MPIIEKLDKLARTRTEDETLAVIDTDDLVHMAHMDIHSFYQWCGRFSIQKF